jgi:hypothetical protein
MSDPALVKFAGIGRNTLGLVFVTLGTAISLTGEYSLQGTWIPVESEFGYWNYLPWYFWVGMCILLAGVYVALSSDDASCHIMVLVMVALVVWCAPTFTTQLPTHADAFWHMNVVEWLATTYRFDPSSIEPYTRLAYLEYPTFFELFGVLMIVARPDPLLVLKSYPVVSAIFQVSGTYVLMRILTRSSRGAFIVTLVAVAGNVAVGSNHFSPSATAQSLFPIVLFLTFRAVELRERATTIATLVICSAFVLLHPVLSLFYLLLACALILSYHARISRVEVKGSWPIFVTVGIAIVYLVWNLYLVTWGFTELWGASIKFQSILKNYAESYLTSQIVARQTVLTPLSGWTRRLLFLGTTVPALAISATQLLRRKLSNPDALLLITVLCWFASSLVTEESDRIMNWIVPFAVLVLLASWKIGSRTPTRFRRLLRRELIGLVLVSMIFLTFASYYANYSVFCFTQAEYTGTSRLISDLQPGDTLYYDNNSPFGIYYELNYFDGPTRVFPTSYQLDRATVVFFTHVLFVTQRMAISPSATYLAYYGLPDDPHFQRIYANGAFVMFKGHMTKS